MSAAPAKDITLAGECIAPGERRDLALPVSSTASGRGLELPLHVWRGKRTGPTLLITAAVHGDECNGTGALQRLIREPGFTLAAGSLVLAPVVNVPGFDRRTRYLPDRRDLNRSFPGSSRGSLTARYAHTVFNEVVRHCDYCLDLHTAAEGRTNFPNVRAYLGNEGCARIAHGFGWPLILPFRGPEGSLRRVATDGGIPTVILEAGEPHKCERGIAEVTLFGIRNLLTALGMVRARSRPPVADIPVIEARWLRTESGGVHRFHVTPGEVVEAGEAIATCSDLLGSARHVVHAPADGVVLGMTTLPALMPGDPLMHLAVTGVAAAEVRARLETSPAAALYERLREDLATNLDLDRLRPRDRSGRPAGRRRSS